MKIQHLIGLAGVLALTACGGGESEGDEATTTTVEATATPTAAAAGVPTAPEGFVEMAASSDMFEIESGRLAEQNATAEGIKSFGAMLVMDHTASSAKLKTAAGEAGVTVPTAMTAKHQGMLSELQNAGDNFDQVFTRLQVAAHQEALNLMQTQAQSGTAEPLKAFAAETAPVIEAHLTQAQGLASSAGGAAAGGAAAGGAAPAGNEG